MVQALPSNTGVVYVMREEIEGNSPGAASPSLAKVIGIVGVPAAGSSPPAFTYSVPASRAAENLRKIWLDVGVNGDGAIIVGDHDQANPIT